MVEFWALEWVFWEKYKKYLLLILFYECKFMVDDKTIHTWSCVGMKLKKHLQMMLKNMVFIIHIY
jgi:hypothetical protein